MEGSGNLAKIHLLFCPCRKGPLTRRNNTVCTPYGADSDLTPPLADKERRTLVSSLLSKEPFHMHKKTIGNI